MTIRHGHAQRQQKSSEYKIWVSMKGRCNNQNHEHYADYGGRGISVCSAWDGDFAAFLEDVGPRPSPAHTLDRFPNNDGNYEPGNVRWATRREQAINRRPRRPCPRVVVNGRPLAELAREHGLSNKTVFAKWRRGIRGDALFQDARIEANQARKKKIDSSVVLR